MAGFKIQQHVSTLDLEYFQYISSVKYKNEISLFCSKLASINQIKFFCMCTIFDDGTRFYLSNMPRWASHYYSLGGKRADKAFQVETYYDNDHYFPRLDPYDHVQNILVELEESVYGHYDTFSIYRAGNGCKLIFLAGHDYAVLDPKKLYLSSVRRFETFCNVFFENFVPVLIEQNPTKKYHRLISDNKFREEIICGKHNSSVENLTPREQELLTLLCNNANVNQISEAMGIQEKTVRNMIFNLTEKYNVSSKQRLIEVFLGQC